MPAPLGLIFAALLLVGGLIPIVLPLGWELGWRNVTIGRLAVVPIVITVLLFTLLLVDAWQQR